MEKYPMFISMKNVIKMSPLPRASYRLNTIPIKISVVFFTEGEKAILKFV